MPYFGVSQNMISMFGLIVVLGMIVDDGIVIGENIFTKLRQGLPPKQAAREGAEEVTWPVLAAIATTCVAFAPLLFMPGRMGTFMEVIPLVVIAALTVSLIEAFMILPAHLSHDYFGVLGKFVPRGIKGLGERFSNKRRDLIEGWLPDNYERWLRFGLRWRYPALALAFAALLGSVGLVASGLIQFQLFERADAETISVDLEMAAGTSAEVTAAVLDRFEARARTLPEVMNVFGVRGATFGESGLSAGADPSVVGQLNVELIASEERERMGLRKSLDVEADLRKVAVGVSGIRKLKISGRAGGPGSSEMKVRVRGTNLDEVAAAVTYIKSKVADFEGVDEIRDDLQPGKQEVRLRLNPSGEALGLTTQGIAVAMRSALFGVEAQDLQAEDEEVKVRVQLPRSDRSSLSDLGRLRIATPAGGRVPLEEVADLSLSRGYASMRRVDGKRAVTVEVGVDAKRGNLAAITAATQRRLADIETRYPGISIEFVGAQKDTRDSLASLFAGFGVALVGIYGIIAVVFRSYMQPFIVMSVIPFAIFGAIIGHLIMGISVQLLSMIGVVALAGIVVNDSLILVDFVNRRLREGAPLLEAVVQGGRARLRAILLTTITTIAGLAPMMLEESFQARFLIPMAISLCFGLAFATFLTLGLVPILYLLAEDIRGGFWRLITGEWPKPIQYKAAEEPA
jgi:multidrug efflux pump subunit AcrB